MGISAVIIAYNEARNIARCIDSLEGIVDEIVVVDGFSTDATPEICRAKGVRFFQHAFDGYAEQKNRANTLARQPWILSLDADEALSSQLRQALRIQKERLEDFDAYAFNRRTNYCGRWIRHCGWYPDRKVRLFRRDIARWEGPYVHERLALPKEARIGFLTGDLLHYSYYTVAEHRTRAQRYAQLGAQSLWAHQKHAYPWDPPLRAAFKWLRNYVFLRGFLDGRAGWTICWISAQETYWKYRHLQKLQSTALT